jgi:hypothetical protein
VLAVPKGYISRVSKGMFPFPEQFLNQFPFLCLWLFPRRKYGSANLGVVQKTFSGSRSMSFPMLLLDYRRLLATLPRSEAWFSPLGEFVCNIEPNENPNPRGELSFFFSNISPFLKYNINIVLEHHKK